MDESWCLKRELKGDVGTVRVTHHVRSPDAEMRQERRTVACSDCECHGLAWRAAAAVAAAVVTDQPVSLGEHGLRKKWPERVGDEGPMNKDHRLTVAGVVVLQCDAINDGSSHASSYCRRGAFRRRQA
jgi:hypothetical protein